MPRGKSHPCSKCGEMQGSPSGLCPKCRGVEEKPQAPEGEKRKGRPKGSKNKPKAAPQSTTPEVTTDATTPTAEVVEEEPKESFSIEPGTSFEDLKVGKPVEYRSQHTRLKKGTLVAKDNSSGREVVMVQFDGGSLIPIHLSKEISLTQEGE